MRAEGPSYRRRVSEGRPRPPEYERNVATDEDLGVLALVLWVVLIIALLWLFASALWMP